MSGPGVPSVLVVFGATGDLMARKIVPSLLYLQRQGALPEDFAVVGFTRRDWTDEDLREHVRSILKEKAADASAEEVESFLELFTFSGGNFDEDAAYDRLAKHLKTLDERLGRCADKLFYLAVPPKYYRTVFERLAESGLTKPCSDLSGWTRVLVEKPFGDDLETAQELDRLLGSLFKEEQIYRIDHYLAKEMLQGIVNFRFTNNLFEPSWDRNGVERIDIRLHETLGVEKRAMFYEHVGALRDVGQNHLLQMLALVTMDQPSARGASAIRQARARAMQEVLRPMSGEDIARNTFRAQYEGYQRIEGVDPESDTETFFRVRTQLHGRRWAGVPVTIESGKRVAEVCKEIVVTLKHPHPCLCDPGQHYQNKVRFMLDPADMIRIEFWAKKPGLAEEVEKRDFTFFLYEKEEKAQYVEEYARLLLDAIRGDQTLFVSTGEVETMWQFIDPIVDAWEEEAVPLHSYRPDTCEAPDMAEEVLAAGPQRGSVGVVGLGKMGAGIALNLLDHGWGVVGYNRSPGKVDALTPHGVTGAYELEELVRTLEPPRIVWLMLTAGPANDAVIFGEGGLVELLSPGDIIIDGGNSYYQDTVKRAERLEGTGIAFMDCGTSGGPVGARHGACLMIGGRGEDFERVEALFADLSVDQGYQFFEGHGAGHFVKMVHNGIEYGMMQAIAEGFHIMHASDYRLDLTRVAEVYQHGSVIESRLVGWLRDAILEFGPEFEGVSSTVRHTGEGEWTVQTAEELGVPAAIIVGALEFRRRSEEDPQYAGKVLSALRNQFGGHAIA